MKGEIEVIERRRTSRFANGEKEIQERFTTYERQPDATSAQSSPSLTQSRVVTYMGGSLKWVGRVKEKEESVKGKTKVRGKFGGCGGISS